MALKIHTYILKEKINNLYKEYCKKNPNDTK